MPYFADWLIENVHLVEITAYSDADAYTIFETMNDRGLSLTPTDMLKGYLLANITDADRRDESAQGLAVTDSCTCSRSAKKRTQTPSSPGCAASMRRPYVSVSAGPSLADFDLIGTEFHRWVRDHDEGLGLTSSAVIRPVYTGGL